MPTGHTAEWTDRLAEYTQWTDEQAQEDSDASYAKAKADYAEYLSGVAGRRERYSAMLTEIRAWEPPTPDHVELKKFMIQQIESCWSETEVSDYYSTPLGCPGARWRARRIAEAEKEIAYHTCELENDKSRNKMRNAWLKALYASLPKQEALNA